MKLTHFIPAVLSFFLIIGILLGYFLHLKPQIIISLSIGLFVVLTVVSYFVTSFLKLNGLFTVFSYLFFVAIGILVVTLHNKKNNKYHYSNYLKTTNRVVLSIKSKQKSTAYYNKYIAEVSQVNNNKTIGFVLLNTTKDTLKTLTIGDVVYTKTTLQKIEEPLNPNQFNYQNFLEKKQIFHQITVGNLKFLKHEVTLYGVMANVRQQILKSLKKYNFNNDELAIINALLLGQRNNVSKTLMQSYTNAGAIHILAVSGLHIGVLLYILQFLLTPLTFLRYGKQIRIVTVIIFLWLYALLAGLSPSIIRAVTMFTAISIGSLFQKRTVVLHSLFISLFILLLLHPLYLFSVGFQLSYLAVFSIIYFYPLFLKIYHPKHVVTSFFWQLFSVSLSAQIGILPLSLFYFHQFPGLFFLSSLVIIPVLGIILGLGIVVIILALLNVLPLSLAYLFAKIINMMNTFITYIGKQDHFLFTHIQWSILLLITSYIIIITWYRFWNKITISRLQFALLSILLFQSVLFFEKHQTQQSNQYIVFNQFRKSLALNRHGKKMTVYSPQNRIKLSQNTLLKHYLFKYGKTVQYKTTMVYSTNNNTVLVVDSLGVYNIPHLKTDIVLLQQSPKINLDRLLKTLKPKLIITDASNYKNDKKQWEITCLNTKTAFYDTSIHGAFVMNY